MFTLLLHYTLGGQGSICFVTKESLVPIQMLSGRCSVNIYAKKKD